MHDFYAKNVPTVTVFQINTEKNSTKINFKEKQIYTHHTEYNSTLWSNLTFSWTLQSRSCVFTTYGEIFPYISGTAALFLIFKIT